jgi:HPt (histidine-containing phosphotransfer) domain-containing protein
MHATKLAQAPKNASPPGSFDWRPGLDRVGGDMGLLRDLAKVFLGDCPRMLKDIRAAVAEGDAKKLKLAAHAIKGSASTFSIQSTTDAALHLENLGRQGSLAGAEESLAVLETELDRLRKELESLVGNNSKE